MSNPWFRLYSEFATDPKIQMMSEAFQRRYIMLLCLRCSNGDVTLQDEEVAFQLRISNDEWSQTKQAFIARGLITEDCRITKWDKRQYISDSSVERVRKHRKAKKQECNVTVTPPDTDTDTDTDISTTTVVDKTTTPKFVARDYLIDNGVTPEVAGDWLTLRRTKKAGATKTAIDGIIVEAGKAEMSLQQVLTMCCHRGWASFKASWDWGDSRAAPSGGAKSETTYQRSMRERVAEMTGRPTVEPTATGFETAINVTPTRVMIGEPA